ncbi:MAG: sulfurtransferase [Ignavibacteriae bacterium HGW-Ignavibacteriae-1]|jgi:phage shock protein E|nr:MAG: sulfurtransferase [Ignavibacteriae bacterium HGW-Ignavibacteriae-1]
MNRHIVYYSYSLGVHLKIAILGFILSLFGLTACAKDKPTKHDNFDLKDIIVIDVRTVAEFNAGHIEGAKLIPYDEIEREIAKVTKDKNAPIAVYCRSGRRSGIAQQTLEAMGYVNVENYGSMGNAKSILERKK